ncbi:hypothetical protein [Bradyrhizobium sp. McL0616]|uniref:hypothetical protein n=1 Tax=Bradyrhizobium sp. McL0616 TaxID=3415674 RepID=UPI003CF63D27
MNQTLFPIDSIETYVRSFSPSVERIDFTLRWPSGDGVNQLSVAPVQVRTFDGLLVSEIVTLDHMSPLLQAMPRDSIANLNTWAISSLVPTDSHGPTRFTSKVCIFSTDQAAAERLYATCSEAVIIGWHAAHIVRNEFRGNPADSPLNLTSEEAPFDNADFEAILTTTDRSGYLGSLGDRHFTVELPWEAGARTNLFLHDDIRESARVSLGLSDEQLDRMAGKTSLLQIRNAQHPLYGKGNCSTLELPFPSEAPVTAKVANELNARELSGADLPPHFGSWCVGNRALSYVSFMPTQFCVPGLLVNLTVWMVARHVRVKQWLMASPSRH